MRSRCKWLKHILATVFLIALLPELRRLIKTICGPIGRTGGKFHREPQRVNCQSIPSTIYHRPDPLLYDQFYLASQGLAVTWDNPDIKIELNGTVVDAHDLLPNTNYDIVARIWNGSIDAPVAWLPVQFSFLTFGIGTKKTHVGTQHVHLGVKGSLSCPAYARQPWKTPSTPGHYCIQVELQCPDDANPANNLGQTNTDVKPLNSPRAEFNFVVQNPTDRPLNLALRADDYTLAALRRCRDNPANVPEQTQQELARKQRETVAIHGKDRFGPPPGWEIRIEPSEIQLEADGTEDVTVVLEAPDNFAGRQAVNINAFVADKLLGGVTLYAEGEA